MARPVQRLGLLCGACMLLACSTLEHGAPSSPDAVYVLARQHQLAHNTAEATLLYRQALLAEPRHVNARNGMATALVEQGDLRGAIALWEGLIAQLGQHAGPSTAYLYSNLGYAYFLDGQYAQARQMQEGACLLDPTSALAWQRLGTTLRKIGDAARAERMQRQAQTLTQHDAHADAALTGSSIMAAATVEEGWARVELVTGADGLLTLQRTAARQPGVVAPRIASLEISNGNGVPGMARATAQRVKHASVRLVRLNNEAGFGVRRTRIEYQPALRAAARRLAQRVQPDAVLVEAPSDAPTGLRLVLGHNAIGPNKS